MEILNTLSGIMSPGMWIVVLFIIGILLHIPIGFSFALACIGCCMLFPAKYLWTFIPTSYYMASDSFTLMAIPFFILAGDLMLNGGISIRLINFAKVLVGHITGSLAICNALACTLFASLSGSGTATVAAIGGIMIPYMNDDGYDKSFSGALSAAAGALGPIIPPSMVMVMYGVTCNASISELFIGGIIPGIILAGGLSVYSYIISKKYKFGTVKPRPPLKEVGKAAINAIWALTTPAIILGGIYTGAFTPTEAAIIACGYAIFVGMVVFKELTLRKLIGTFRRSAITGGSCLILVGGATAFGKIMAYEGITDTLVNAFFSISTNPIIIMLILNVLLLLIGMFMDTFAAVILLAPLLLDVVTPLGISPVHFGVIMCFNLSIGLITPPVGVNTFVAIRLTNEPLESMMKWLIPLTIVMFVVQLLITYCPALVTWLPSLMN